jgi:hypothetical protein
MSGMLQAVVALATALCLVGSASAQTVVSGAHEFSLTEKELVQAVEKVEALLAQCMREQGFEYVAVDYQTVRKAMAAKTTLPGMSEEQFIRQHGFGISIFYTGQGPQLASGYNPARVGLGEQNIQIYNKLSPADQVAYNRALLGEHTDATFAVALDMENFSRCGGCTLKAVERVFKPEHLKATYVNPKDALIKNDRRMKEALRRFAEAMRKAGFNYNDPDEIEPDLWNQLFAITGNGTIPIKQLSPEQSAALKKLQEYERRVAKISVDLKEKFIDPIEMKIEKELLARDVK